MQNMVGHPQRVIKPWQYQFTREDFYHPDEVRGCRWAIRVKQNPKMRSYVRPLWLRLAQQRRGGSRPYGGNYRVTLRLLHACFLHRQDAVANPSALVPTKEL